LIVVTAQPSHKLRALQAGAKDFVSKPFDLGEVLMRVRNMLEVRLLHSESLQHGKELAACQDKGNPLSQGEVGHGAIRRGS